MQENEPSPTSMRQMVLEIFHFKVRNLGKMDSINWSHNWIIMVLEEQKRIERDIWGALASRAKPKEPYSLDESKSIWIHFLYYGLSPGPEGAHGLSP